MINFYSVKDNVKKMKRKALECSELFAKYIYYKDTCILNI